MLAGRIPLDCWRMSQRRGGGLSSPRLESIKAARRAPVFVSSSLLPSFTGNFHPRRNGGGGASQKQVRRAGREATSEERSAETRNQPALMFRVTSVRRRSEQMCVFHPGSLINTPERCSDWPAASQSEARGSSRRGKEGGVRVSWRLTFRFLKACLAR